MKNVIHGRSQVARSAQIEAPVRLERFSRVADHASMGRMSYLSELSTLARGCQLGRYCSVARFVEIGPIEHPVDFLSTHPFQYSKHHFANQEAWDRLERCDFDETPGAIVGNDVLIGLNAVILRGVTVGHGAIIGAGAVVTKDVPPYAIVVGSPAKILRYRFDAETIQRLLVVAWWDMDLEALSGLPFDDIEVALNLLEQARAQL